MDPYRVAINSFQDLKDTLDEEFQNQQDEYGAMKDQKIIGKDTLVEFLKSYRDSLQSVIDSYASMLK